MSKKTFGEKIYPKLNKIEDTIWKEKSEHNNIKPNYPQEAIRSASCIFFDVFADLAYNNYKSKGYTFDERMIKIEEAGNTIRELILENTGLDMHKLMQDKLKKESDYVEEID